jgi:Domain of unknown function (DUF4907)
MKQGIVVFSAVILFSCGQQPDSQTTVDSGPVEDTAYLHNTMPVVTGEIEYIIFRTDTIGPDSLTGWGYDIYVDKKRMIRQPHIPAVPGKKPFDNSPAAESVASLVIYKITNNIMPPSVTQQELDSLEIDY